MLGPPGWLKTDAVLRVFSDERTTAVTDYRRLKAEGIGAASQWQGLKGQIYLGCDQFAERMQARIDPTRPPREVPKRQRRALAKPLADDADRWPDRDRAMAEAYRTGAYSMQGIAGFFGVSIMTVSRGVKRHENPSATPNVTCEHPSLSVVKQAVRRQASADQSWRHGFGEIRLDADVDASGPER